jgi:tubulin delta
MEGPTLCLMLTSAWQALRDEFPSSHCINCCVWPYESGEVLVQVGGASTLCAVL